MLLCYWASGGGGRIDICICLLTAVGLTPGGSSTIQCTFTHKEYIEKHNKNNTINNKNNAINNKSNTISNKNETIKTRKAQLTTEQYNYQGNK